MDEVKNEQQAHFEQVPVDLLKDTALTESELVFYVLIVRLSSQKGYCYATNKYIGSLRGKNWRTAQRVIESLKKKNYIRVEVSGKYERKIFPLRYVNADVGGTSILSWGYGKSDAGGTSDLTKRYVKNDVKNNTKNNTKRISICANESRTSTPSLSENKSQKVGKKKKAASEKSFIPPTVEEVRAYVNEKGYNVNPEKFVEYYEAGEPAWTDKDGKPIRSWKQKVITWSRKNGDTRTQSPAAYSPWNHLSNQVMSEEEQKKRDQEARLAAGYKD